MLEVATVNRFESFNRLTFMQAAKHGLLRRRLIIDKQLYTIPPGGWLELESVIVKLADF